MNELTQAYRSGSSLAYRDTAKVMRELVAKSPPDIRKFLERLMPLADACDKKALEVFKEVARLETAVRR